MSTWASWEDLLDAYGSTWAEEHGAEWQRTEARMARGKRARRRKSDGTSDFMIRLPGREPWRIEAKEGSRHHGAWPLSPGVEPKQISYLDAATDRGEEAFILLRWSPPETRVRPPGCRVWLLAWGDLAPRYHDHQEHLQAMAQRRHVKARTGIVLEASEAPPPFALDELDTLAIKRWDVRAGVCPPWLDEANAWVELWRGEVAP